MIRLSTFFFFLFFAHFLYAQTFTLIIQNGYGSGQYAAGDTVHIWAKEWQQQQQVFDRWTGNGISFAEDSQEWHTKLVMPPQNVNLTANFKNMPSNSDLKEVQIRGRDRLKRVFYWFPSPNIRPKGAVWCFHGSGGSANGWVNSLENRQFVNACIADTFAIIITECEERTLNEDTNNDGKIRWNTFPPDSVNNVDYANIRILRDSMLQRGLLQPETPLFAVGMSNGGAFSVTLAAYYRWKATVSYCAPGGKVTANLTQTPTRFNMALNDNNENVGPTGNQEALENSQTIQNRQICSRFSMHGPSPVYPERFRRNATITAARSLSIFNDLKNNGCLSPKNFLLFSGAAIANQIQTEPTKWPGISSLNGVQRAFVFEQIDVIWSDHQFYSDYTARTIRFFKAQCADGSVSSHEAARINAFSIQPNPSIGSAQLIHTSDAGAEGGQLYLYNTMGQILWQTTLLKDDFMQSIPLPNLTSGLYFVHFTTKKGDKSQTFRWIVQGE
jgi:hypothetical protein